jgi:hypothetical protein
MSPFWRKDAHPSQESERAVASSNAELIRARALRSEVAVVREEAVRSLKQNHYGAAITAAMGRNTDGFPR